MDNPLAVEAIVEKLSDKERKAFDLGYLVALMGQLEQYTDTKNRILTKCLDLEDENHKRQLLSRVHILDVFEKHLRRRVRVLEPEALEA